MEIYLKQAMTLWYSEKQDIAIIYITFSDETQMKIHYKEIKQDILIPTQIKYENRVVSGITAELDAKDIDFKWKLRLIIPEMNLNETFNFYLNTVKEDTFSLRTIEDNLQQMSRLKKAKLKTIQLLSDEQQAQRIKNKNPAKKKMITAEELGLC